MKNLYLILFMFVSLLPANAFNDVVLPQSGYNESNNAVINEVISDEDFNELEKKILKKTYPADSAIKRLSRLEKEVFGMEQNGDTLKDYEERIENLFTAAQYYQDGYRANESTKEYYQNQKYYTYKDMPSQNSPTESRSSQRLNAWNYIQDYDYNQIPGYSEKEAKRLAAEYESQRKPNNQRYYDDNELETKRKQNTQTGQKQSKIKQFFQDLTDALTAGIVTGYTPSITGSDIYDAFTDFGGSNYIGPSIYSSYPYHISRYNSPYNNVPRRHYYNPYHSRRYAPMPPPQSRTRYYNRGYNPYHSYHPRYYPSAGNYKSGAGIKIIN